MEVKCADDGETLLLNRWFGGDESALKALVERYKRIIFSLVLYLTGCGRDEAFVLTVSIFTEVIRSFRSLRSSQKESFFLQELIRTLIGQCPTLSSTAAFDLSDFTALPASKKESFRIVKESLFALSFENKCLLLLRDQWNFSYDTMTAILGLPVKEVRSKTFQARILLRDQMKEILDRARSCHNGLR